MCAGRRVVYSRGREEGTRWGLRCRGFVGTPGFGAVDFGGGGHCEVC
jgi:hypothetical protein